MNRLVFVTTEIQPETPGGAGVAVEALSGGLSKHREVVVLLLTHQPVEVRDRKRVTVVQATIPHEGFIERSMAAAAAVSEVVRPGDRVEFQDFEGIAFHSLASRGTYGLDRALCTVRFHGTYDLIGDAMETSPLGMEIPAAMEKEVMGMADLVLVASSGQVQTVATRYQIEPSRIAVSPLPIPPLPIGKRRPTTPPVFAVIGRLDERKGPQDVVRAATRLLDRKIDLRVRFIGLDGWSPTNYSSTRVWLESLMGPHAPAFEFTGPVPRDQLAAAVADVTAVIVPSRFETFCYVAYEARMLGQPLIVADLDVFKGLFSPETGALVYDRSAKGLAQVMRKVVSQPKSAEDLAGRPVPQPGEPWPAYESDPQPRHPRSQAGLGTAAVQRLEAATLSGPTRPHRSFLERIYARIPSRLVAIGYKVIPRPLQRKLAKRLSWTQETRRRSYEALIDSQAAQEPPRRADQEEQAERLAARVETFTGRLAAGEFAEIKDPDVTVVVPVYNDISFLEETLLSVYEQTHGSWEIVIVDDGSSTPEARKFLNRLKRPRLRLLRQKNMGLPAARNAGIKVARGRYVVPLDADDQLLPTYMETLLAALEKSPRAGYAHCYALLHHDIDAYWITRPFNPYWQLLGNGVFGCAMIRRAALDAVGGYDETMRSGNEDWELWLRLMAAGWEQVQIHEVLVMYRKHGVSMSVVTEAKFEEGRRMVRDRHEQLYTQLPALKQGWYPLVTVLGDRPPSGNVAIETVATVAELADTWGKYVVDLRGVEATSEETLLSLANTLESRPELARAMTGGSPPVIMLRRWNLHDPEAAPSGDITLDLPDTGSSAELPSHVARDGWTVPPISGEEWRKIQRQPPEEAGVVPDVWGW